MVIDSASKLYLSLIYCLVKFVLRSSNMISFLVDRNLRCDYPRQATRLSSSYLALPTSAKMDERAWDRKQKEFGTAPVSSRYDHLGGRQLQSGDPRGLVSPKTSERGGKSSSKLLTRSICNSMSVTTNTL